MFAWILLLACEQADPTSTVPPGCGDGALAAGEQCDDGAANSDDAPGACRTDCLLARCGDGVVDAAEACDDGATWAGDGCDPQCAAEADPGEVEPNDVLFYATPTANGDTRGALPTGDTDCFAINVPADGWLDVRVATWEEGCDQPLVLQRLDADGDVVTDAVGDGTSCAHLDPAEDSDLTFLPTGPVTVCVRSLLGVEVAGYALRVTVGDDSCDGPAPPPPELDPDGDGLANVCDGDDDGDGLQDAVDNCPLIPNGPATDAVDTHEDGWIDAWLLLGPFSGDAPTDTCLPSPEPRADEPAHEPILGQTVGELPWFAARADDHTLDFHEWVTASTPRDVYAAAWLFSPTARPARLDLGADDGASVWLGDQHLADIDTCQGVSTDQFRYDVDLIEGWNLLMVKVRDRGGGWGMRARLKTRDGDPLRDLLVSLGGPAPWRPDQSDRDGDGLGDVCDPTP